MAIRSKYNYRHKYIDLEPIFDRKTGQCVGEVFARKEDEDLRLHLRIADLVGDTEEENEFLEELKNKVKPVRKVEDWEEWEEEEEEKL